MSVNHRHLFGNTGPTRAGGTGDRYPAFNRDVRPAPRAGIPWKSGYPMHAPAFLRKRWSAGLPAFDCVTGATIRSELFVRRGGPWLA